MQMSAISSTAWAIAAFNLLAALVTSVAAVGTTFAAEPQAPTSPATLLDGKSFRGQMLDGDGRVITDKEKLVFRNGKFVSEACRQYGFAESPYWIRVEDGKIHFLAETVSSSNGTMLWKGSVSSGKLDASFIWSKERWYWTVRRQFSVRGNEER